jgi:aminopeptidase I
MVRNVASMQSLRHNMEDMNFDAPPRRTLYEESNASSRPQPSSSRSTTTTSLQSQQHPIVQLCGTDDYTKQLMNRVATGVATEAEQKAFAQHVQRGLPELVGASSTRSSSRRSSPPEDKSARFKQATRENAEKYTKPFCDFLTNNPTVFHCVDAVKTQLKDAGWKELSERDAWKIEPSGKYFVERNGSALMAFSVGGQYKPGNGAAILAGHVDALTAKLKPVSQVPNKAGYIQLGVAPYAGAPNNTWWDRDLGIGGRVLVKENNKIVSKLVKLDWPIARIPTLAPHFGAAAQGPFNPETQMVPIIGLEDSEEQTKEIVEPFSKPSLIGSAGGSATTFASTQPPRLVRVIANELGLKASDYGNIINWELELFDVQPATVGGIDKEFIFAGRVDDKLCSWAAIQALVDAQATDTADSSIIKAVGLFDDEEIGSLLRQGAKGNFLPSVIERAVTSLNNDVSSSSIIGQTYANSFLVSSDVIHAVNPNFLGAYLENHSPRLNVGIVVSADSNGHMTTDSVSTAIMQRCADKVGAKLQVFQIRNDSRSGGTVGPMLSSATGIRAIDCGIPQLSMHSVRATTGNLDPGLGVMAFLGFLNGFESVDKEFR